MRTSDLLTIGEVSARADLTPPALRYYESLGLVSSVRTAGGQRRYTRSVLRRLAFVRAGQQVGLTLDEIAQELQRLPEGRTPTRSDWARLSRGWQDRVDAKIAELTHLRDALTSCIGCGCLSLRTCRLYNPDDIAHTAGAGARYLLGDGPKDFRDPGRGRSA